MYEQELSLYGLQKNNLTNDQWYEKFNTKVDVGNTIGFTSKHEVLLKWTSQQLYYTAFVALKCGEK